MNFTLSVLTFDGIQLGLPIEQLLSVEPIQDVHWRPGEETIPDKPLAAGVDWAQWHPDCLGVVAAVGQYLPVFSLSNELKCSSRTSLSRFVGCFHVERVGTAAFLCEKLESLVCGSEQYTELPDLMRGEHMSIKGVVNRAGAPVLVADTARMMEFARLTIPLTHKTLVSTELNFP